MAWRCGHANANPSALLSFEHPSCPCLQANARIAAGPSNQSLLRQWITKIVAGYSSKVT
jgi:hypothetical protein